MVETFPVMPSTILVASETNVSDSNALNVAFPGMPTPKAVAPPVAVPVPVPVMVPVFVPVPETTAAPRPLQPEHNNIVVSKMNGEVHFKHLGGPRLDPARALYIETGAGSSWCEFKMQNCTGRVWAKSQISVFPDTGVIYLKKGALIIHTDRNSGSRFSVIAGDFASRMQGTTLRVQRDDRRVDFQVMEGTVTVYNKLTGEVYKAHQVTQPAAPAK